MITFLVCGQTPTAMDVLLTISAPEPVTEGAPAQPRAKSATQQSLVRQVIDQHYSFVWRMLRRLGLEAADAEDAAQHVFLVAVRRGLTGSPEQARPFLYGITTRVAANMRKKLRRRREVTQAEVECSEIARSSPERDLEVQQAMSLLDHLLEQLPLSLRLVFVLAEIEELSLAEIAKLEGIPQGTAASRLRRAREQFQSELERFESRERFIQQAGTRRK